VRWLPSLRGSGVAAVLLAAAAAGTPARAAWEPEGVDLARPRILFRPGDLPAIQAKLARDPFPQVIARMLDRVALADSVALDDDTIEGQRFKARAAKNLAFLYAVDRTLVNGEVVPFASHAERQAVGDRVRDLLVHLYPRCRLLVRPPLGGWDRDISTSEELLQWATAYDALLGAGYDFGASEAEIVERIASLASELYLAYVDPYDTASNALLHQNNHRSKSGAALVMAAIALAEYEPAPGSDPAGLRDPARWLAYGLQQVDRVMRWAIVAGDGAYGEGPFYLRYASQNLLPFARAWDRLVGGAAWDADGVSVPSPWRHPLFRRGQRWLLDMTLPDGSLAPQDDGNPGRAYYFGAAPADPADLAAFAWRFANAPAPFEGDGNVDLGPDTLVVFDPDVTPAPPAGSPSAFYPEGGNAIFRSDWSRDAVVAIVQGERDEAALFGRDRDGVGVFPQSHEHAEPGAFLLAAFGEVLALDPGYLSFGLRFRVNQPEHHSTILVDGRGPLDPLGGSLLWELEPLARPPVDGQASLVDTLDTAALDAARVIVRYGTGSYGDPYAGAPRIERRFLFAADRYLVVADRVTAEAGAHDLAWLVHGNGGGSSGGAFEPLSSGARWTRPNARLDALFAVDAGGAPGFATRESVHEAPNRLELTHTALEANASGADLRSVLLLYPTPAAAPAPMEVALGLPGAAALRLDDAAGDRRVLVAHRAPAATPLAFGPAATGGGAFATDGALALVDLHADGRLRQAFAEGARTLAWNGGALLRAKHRGNVGIALAADRAELVAETADAWIRVGPLGFRPRRADGACALRREGDATWLKLGRERRATLHAGRGNAAPAADPGADRRVAVGALVDLDGRASCDADGDALTPRWELVSAPPGSDWNLTGADGWRPRLAADRPGPFRVRLVVTDARGAASRPVEVRIAAGGLCEGGLDEDRDGRIDGDDPDCDAGPTDA
jgi:hypothetical protein